MKRLALILGLAACLAALGAATAPAHSAKSYPTTSNLEVKKTTIAGKLSSPKAGCLKGRTVHGVYLAPGQHLITEAVKSDGSGRWSIDFEIVSGSKGRMVITIAPKTLGGGVTCKGSETAQVVAVK